MSSGELERDTANHEVARGGNRSVLGVVHAGSPDSMRPVVSVVMSMGTISSRERPSTNWPLRWRETAPWAAGPNQMRCGQRVGSQDDLALLMGLLQSFAADAQGISFRQGEIRGFFQARHRVEQERVGAGAFQCECDISAGDRTQAIKGPCLAGRRREQRVTDGVEGTDAKAQHDVRLTREISIGRGRAAAVPGGDPTKRNRLRPLLIEELLGDIEELVASRSDLVLGKSRSRH